jgi:diguanylate cyclase (GGDEF)-like protein
MSKTPDESEQSNIDALTGLYNRRFLDEVLPLEVERAKRYRLALTMLLIKIDRFEQLNETFGHITGDKVIKSVADFLRSSLRRVDYLFRCGPDEFSIVLPSTNLEGASLVAARIRSGIETMDFRKALPGNSVPHLSIRVSIGARALDRDKKRRDDDGDESGVPAHV